MEPRAVYYRLQSLWVAPTISLKINNDAPYTKSTRVTLTQFCTDITRCVPLLRAQYSNDNVTWSSPANYAMTTSWTLISGDGEKTVYARFMDDAGNWSGVFNDSIVLDATVPLTTASPGGGGTYTVSQTVTLTCGTGRDRAVTKRTTQPTVPCRRPPRVAMPIRC